MAKPLPALQQTEDYPLRRAQEYVRTAFRSLQQAAPFLDGIYVGPVLVGTTEVKIDHRLGRAPAGLLVVKVEIAAVLPVGVLLFRAADRTTLTVVQSSGGNPASYTLWIF